MFPLPQIFLDFANFQGLELYQQSPYIGFYCWCTTNTTYLFQD